MNSKNYKAGLFVLGTLILLGYMILRVNQDGFLFSNSYKLHMTVATAAGLAYKTPVQIAGVPVGIVSDIKLDQNSRAKLTLEINKDVKIFDGAKANIKTTGILGDAYVEILQPGELGEALAEGSSIESVQGFSDLNSVTDTMGQIAEDVKAITTQMRKLMAGDDSSFDKTFKNIEKITAYLARNENNVNVSMSNIKAITENLNAILAANRSMIYQSATNVAGITGSINEGEGTIGRLVKSDETLEKIHESLDNLNNLVGGVNRFNVKLGGHTEFLGGTGDFKNYVTFALQPRPDKFFLFEVVSDPNPSFTRTVEETTVTTGGQSTSITTQRQFKELDDLRFSAQFAKKFQNFTMRGGLIESTGGVGLDYAQGPIGVQFSAFDFKTDDGEKPHLKVMSTAHVTNTFYLLGGFDDFINPNQDLDWFVGAGFSFNDEDIKNLFGLFGASR